MGLGSRLRYIGNEIAKRSNRGIIFLGMGFLMIGAGLVATSFFVVPMLIMAGWMLGAIGVALFLGGLSHYLIEKLADAKKNLALRFISMGLGFIAGALTLFALPVLSSLSFPFLFVGLLLGVGGLYVFGGIAALLLSSKSKVAPEKLPLSGTTAAMTQALKPEISLEKMKKAEFFRGVDLKGFNESQVRVLYSVGLEKEKIQLGGMKFMGLANNFMLINNTKRTSNWFNGKGYEDLVYYKLVIEGRAMASEVINHILDHVKSNDQAIAELSELKGAPAEATEEKLDIKRPPALRISETTVGDEDKQKPTDSTGAGLK